MAKKNTAQNRVTEPGESGFSLSKAELFIERNKKMLTRIALVVFLIVGGIVAGNRYYLKPKQKEAEAELFYPVQYFKQDSFQLALNLTGQSQYYGFEEIIEDYKFTKAANLAKYYAGVSYLRLGEYEQAIKYLESFRKKGTQVGTVATGAIGDAYTQLEEYEEAVKYYAKAANKNPNSFTTPLYLIKLAAVYDVLGEYENALEAYQRIQKEYPKQGAQLQIEKYIAEAKMKASS